MMLLLSLWAVLVLVIPNLSPHLARMLRPTPGALGVEDQRIAKERDIRQGVRQKISTWREKNNNTETDRMKRQYEQRKFSVRAHGEGWVDTLNAWEKIDEPRRRRMDAQVRLSRWIGRASPFTCFAMAATELADAGVMHERRLWQQLRDFQVELTEYGTDEYVALLDKELAAGGNRVDWRHNRQKPLPVFGYSPAAGWDYWKAVSVDAGILAAMTVVLFLLSYVAFLRYDVR